jgi:hypothetical protein
MQIAARTRFRASHLQVAFATRIGEKTMTSQMGRDSQDAMVVGYFAEGSDAYRAIHELIDEGFKAAEIGAAFRTPRAGTGRQEAAVGELSGVGELTERNPALYGSVGGPASGDGGVTPAGLATGSGNSFPGASKPGPIPGSEIPQTLKHDLRETLPHDPPSPLWATSTGGSGSDDRWLDHLSSTYGSATAETAKNRNSVAASNQKFGTGEGTLGLFPEYEYSASTFEGSFAGMGLGPEQARSLSGELGRGGAVVTVSAGERFSLAEAILGRNHGRVRFEYAAGTTTPKLDRESPVQVYGSMRSYYRADEELRRKAS